MKVRQVLEQGKQDLSSYSYLSDFKLYPNANAGDYIQRGKESGAREFREKKKRCSKYVNIHLLLLLPFN